MKKNILKQKKKNYLKYSTMFCLHFPDYLLSSFIWIMKTAS